MARPFALGLASACAIACTTTIAHADDLLEGTAYVAARRPLEANRFPGPPNIRRNIVGAALEWEHLPVIDESGVTLRAGAAVEHQADCARESGCAFPGGSGPRQIDQAEYTSTLPDNHVEVGGHARIGWSWRYVALEGGALAYRHTLASNYRTEPPAGVSVVPDLVLRVGERNAYLALGYGSFAATTLIAPGAYVQGAVGFAERWRTVLTGAYDDVVGYFTWRVDVALAYRVTERIRVGAGFALTWVGPKTDRSVGGDMRLQVAWLF